MTNRVVSDLVRAWHRLPLSAWLVLGALALAGVGLTLGLPAALLVLSGVALTGAVFLGYSSLVALTGEVDLTLEEALTLVAPSAEEEQKRSILRALKDLQYELAVGKISPEDHAALTARYRDEARGLLQIVNELQADQLARAERRIREHLRDVGASVAPEPTSRSTPEIREAARSPGSGRQRRPRCRACGRLAARSARFCSTCGAPLSPASSPSTPRPKDREA
ncbi:MAG TPA: zinc ribbon domain-containing protein [Polyangiaceae bacterium]|nr:zinc ribbon domain-containing protein [Polyangiaceae bacterium]